MPSTHVLSRRYELGGLLWQVGALMVYRAVDRRLARPVTVELLEKNAVSDPRQIMTFQQRARKLASHPHNGLAGVHDVGEETDVVYAVMDPLQGTTLSEVLEYQAPMPLGAAVDLSVAIVASVEAATELRLLDSVPDPSFIYVREADRVKMGGLLYSGSDREPLPADPSEREQLLVQALAMLLAEMLIGRQEDGGPVVELPPTVPAALHRLMNRAIQPGPDEAALSLKDWSHALRRQQTTGQHMTSVVARRTSGQGPMRTAVLPRAAPVIPSRYGGPTARPGRGVQGATGGMSCFSMLITGLVLLTLAGAAVSFAFWLAGGVSSARVANKSAATATLDAPATTLPRPTASLARATTGASRTPLPTQVSQATQIGQAAQTSQGTATETPAETATPTITTTPTPTPTEAPTSTAVPSPTSSPVPQVIVPGLVGKPLDQATALAQKLGLKVVKESDLVSDQFPAGQIVQQTPPEGAVVSADTPIKVIVAKAPPNPTIPDVTKIPADQAQAVLTAAGFTPKVTTVVTNQAPEGSVVSQSPSAGTSAPKGTEVTIVVAATDKVIVPNVIGLSEADAQAAIKAAGLQTGPANHSGNSVIVPVGKVESQQPPAGTQVSRGTVVLINIRVK